VESTAAADDPLDGTSTGDEVGAGEPVESTAAADDPLDGTADRQPRVSR
jgi:hypothetical protein